MWRRRNDGYLVRAFYGLASDIVMQITHRGTLAHPPKAMKDDERPARETGCPFLTGLPYSPDFTRLWFASVVS